MAVFEGVVSKQMRKGRDKRSLGLVGMFVVVSGVKNLTCSNVLGGFQVCSMSMTIPDDHIWKSSRRTLEGCR